MNTAELDFNLKGKSLSELEQLFAELGQPKFRAKQAFRRVNLHLATSLDDFSEFPKSLREELAENNAMPTMPVRHRSAEAGSHSTEKFVFDVGLDPRRGKTESAKSIEAVWIVSENRRTVCISSQAGCTLNCSFCATGTLQFLGNLPAWQIVEQVYELTRVRGERVSNVVFMGMGEPFHNYEDVIKAARILHHPEGLNIGARHITISTAGVIPSIERFTTNREPFNLAISLNHSDPAARGEIMDVDKKYPLDKLLIAARAYTRAMERRITFEYVMIPGVNMNDEHLRRLIKIGRSVRCKINLIPLNTTLQGWRRPSLAEAQKFQGALLDAGLTVFNRGSPGKDVNGACGMLALEMAGGASTG
ncbi:MAG: 23S rRNA (adenine(2503)-C(2))-methyltransferase RlmN [bacterium]|nr:23S rRNA (adenine(2503)-C(2))-methyltransferase RlmN [bacterium]